jgi:hypothetical protein
MTAPYVDFDVYPTTMRGRRGAPSVRVEIPLAEVAHVSQRGESWEQKYSYVEMRDGSGMEVMADVKELSMCVALFREKGRGVPMLRNIKRLDRSYYSVSIPMDQLESTLARYDERGILQLDPDFQRGIKWDSDQQTAYVEWLFRDGHTGREFFWNCPGWMQDFRGPMVLVDGRQRLEAVLSFLRGDIRAFGFHSTDFADLRRQTMNNNLTFNVAAMSSRADLLRWYIDLNSGGTAHAEEDITRAAELLEREESDGKG